MEKVLKVVLAVLVVSVLFSLLLGAIGRGVGPLELLIMAVAYGFALRYAIRRALAPA